MFLEEVSLKVLYNGENVKMTIYPWDPLGKFTDVNVDYFIGVYTNENFEDIPLIEIGELSRGIFTELSRVKELESSFSIMEKALRQVYSGRKKVRI